MVLTLTEAEVAQLADARKTLKEIEARVFAAGANELADKHVVYALGKTSEVVKQAIADLYEVMNVVSAYFDCPNSAAYANSTGIYA